MPSSAPGGEEEHVPERRVDAALERASRALSALDPGADGEFGARLLEVREALSTAAEGGDIRAARLLKRFEAMVFQPGRDGGAELAALDRATHAARQLTLLASAAITGIDSPDSAHAALLRALLRAAGVSPDSEEAVIIGRTLRGEVRGFSAEAGAAGLEARDAGQVLRALGVRLLSRISLALERSGHSPAAQVLKDRLARGAGRPRIDGALARVLLQQSGPGEGGVAARFLDRLLQGSLGTPQEVAAALIAESGCTSGSLREVIGRHLAAREFEHAWNAARREFGEPLTFGFAIPDEHGRFATAQLVGDERGGGATSESGAGSCHVTVGVDLSALGPVRADLAVRADQVAVRLTVADPAVAQRIRLRAGELEALLGSEGRRVLLAVAEGTEEEARVDARQAGLKPEDHVMDLEG